MKRGCWNGMRLKGSNNTCEGDGKHSLSGKKRSHFCTFRVEVSLGQDSKISKEKALLTDDENLDK